MLGKERLDEISRCCQKGAISSGEYEKWLKDRAKMTGADEVKVQFRLDPKDQQGFETESLWAQTVGPNRFRIVNSPFFVFGVSADDVVAAEEADGVRSFLGVVSRGGHSTYRVFLQGDRTIKDADFLTYWTPISTLGSTFENVNNHFVAIDIPPGRDVAAIYKLLEKGEQDGIWVFEEAHYGGVPGEWR